MKTLSGTNLTPTREQFISELVDALDFKELAGLTIIGSSTSTDEPKSLWLHALVGSSPTPYNLYLIKLTMDIGIGSCPEGDLDEVIKQFKPEITL